MTDSDLIQHAKAVSESLRDVPEADRIRLHCIMLGSGLADYTEADLQGALGLVASTRKQYCDQAA